MRYFLCFILLICGCQKCNCNCGNCGIECRNRCEENRCVIGNPCCKDCTCSKLPPIKVK